MNFFKKSLVLTFSINLLLVWSTLALDLDGTIIPEIRVFPDKSANEITHHENLSLGIEPKLTESISNSTYTLVPFARIDQQDARRSHIDLREFNVRTKADDWEYLVGVSRINWGVGASFKIVDIISQLDFVEHPVWQPKLGQPMVNIKRFIEDHGFEVFVLPGFRERTFAGSKARLRFTPRIDMSRVSYESSAEDKHVDFAGHYFFKDKDIDAGIYQFWGTSRDPTFLIESDSNGDDVFAPYYPIIHQTGAHAKVQDGDMTWKFEGLHRINQGDAFNATISGFEYNLEKFIGGKEDIHLLVEYHYADSASAGAVTPFENDLFIGAIVFLNDNTKTWFGAGEVYDMNTPAQSIVVLGNTTLSDDLSLAYEFRGLAKLPKTDPVYSLRRDEFFQIQLVYNL